MFLGGVEVPSSFQAPAPQNIGKFTTRAHNVASGEVTILDDRTISIKSLRYDGQGPGMSPLSDNISTRCSSPRPHNTSLL